jgi:hypothetical protein
MELLRKNTYEFASISDKFCGLLYDFEKSAVFTWGVPVQREVGIYPLLIWQLEFLTLGWAV